VVWRFTGSALVGVGAGYAVDRYVVGTGSYGVLVGGLVGSGVGFYAFIRGATKLLDAQSKRK
jgi:F0F1-type ATP synthase assembly protein I